MLKQHYRIGSKPRIEYILKKGKQARGRLFFIRFLPNRLTIPRFALVLSGKISKKAVERNLLRRRIYEAIRLYLSSTLERADKTCYDIVVLCSGSIKKTTYADIERDVSDCLNKLL